MVGGHARLGHSGAKAADLIRTRARAGLDEPNPIVLLHDGGGDRRATVAALPGIIDDYRQAGYAFVTLGRRPPLAPAPDLRYARFTTSGVSRVPRATGVANPDQRAGSHQTA